MLIIILLSVLYGIFSSIVSIFFTEKIIRTIFNKKNQSKNYIMFSKLFYILVFMILSIFFSISIRIIYPMYFEESLRQFFIIGYFSAYFILFLLFAFRKEI